jgi:uncharacterized phage infection (PIP) family protein YhgE
VIKNRLSQAKARRSNPNLKRELETKLKAEISMVSNDKKRLEKSLRYEKRARGVKTRQLVDRKESIRKELTKLWQGAKDLASSERHAIVVKYEAELSAVTDTLRQLQNEKQKAADFRELADDVASLKRTRRQEEQAFVNELSSKNDVVSHLTGRLPTLKSELQHRNKIIEEYETDFCKILKQSLKICRKYFQG